jgi:transcriptional regulator with PAS, ATPase and Fis domain
MVLHENKIIEGHDISFDDLGLADEAQKESLPASVEPHRSQANYSSELTGILSALQASSNRAQAAEQLGISPRTLRQKLFEFRKAGHEVPRAYARS